MIIILCLMMLLSALASPLTAFADERAARWAYIAGLSFNIGFPRTNEGEVYAVADYYDTCIYSEGRLTLYEMDDTGSWVRIGMWIDSTFDDSMFLVGDFEAKPGYEYKATFWIKTYGGQNAYEEDTFEDYATCPNAAG